MPSALNSSSTAPLSAAMEDGLPPATGRPPAPTPAKPMRIAAGFSSARATDESEARTRTSAASLRVMAGSPFSEAELELGEHLGRGDALPPDDVLLAAVDVDLRLGRLGEEDVQAGGVDVVAAAGVVPVGLPAVVADERLPGLGPPVVELALGLDALEELLAEAVERRDGVGVPLEADLLRRADIPDVVDGPDELVGETEGEVVVVEVRAEPVSEPGPGDLGGGGRRGGVVERDAAEVGGRADAQLTQPRVVFGRDRDRDAPDHVLEGVVVVPVRPGPVDDAEGEGEQRLPVRVAEVVLGEELAAGDEADLPRAEGSLPDELCVVDDRLQLLAGVALEAEGQELLTEREREPRAVVLDGREELVREVRVEDAGGADVGPGRRGRGHAEREAEVPRLLVVAVEEPVEREDRGGDVEGGLPVVEEGRIVHRRARHVRRQLVRRLVADVGAVPGAARLHD